MKNKTLIIHFLLIVLFVSCGGDDKDLVEVVNKQEIVDLNLSETKIVLSEGETKVINVNKSNGKCTVTVDNDNSSTSISEDGKIITIKALKVGASKVTVKDEKDKVVVVEVIISEVFDLKIAETKISLGKDETKVIGVIKSNGKCTVTVDNDNSSASISEDGKIITIKALKVGKSKVTVKDEKDKELVVEVVIEKTAYNIDLKNYTIVAGVLKAIADGAIQEGVVIVPDGVTKVNFQDSNDETTITSKQNNNLKEIIIGDSKTGEPVTIGDWGFDGEIKIEKITLGENVAIVGTAAFMNLNKLKEFTIKNKDISFDNSPFYKCVWTEKPTLYIPKGSLEVFKKKENFDEYFANFTVKELE